MMNTNRAIVVITPDGKSETISYTGREAKLEDLQRHVGGFIEHVRVRYQGALREAYVNEEGRLVGLPFNPEATLLASEFGYGPIVGSMVIDLPRAPNVTPFRVLVNDRTSRTSIHSATCHLVNRKRKGPVHWHELEAAESPEAARDAFEAHEDIVTRELPRTTICECARSPSSNRKGNL